MNELKAVTDNEEWISKSKGLCILGILAVHSIQRFSISYIVTKPAYAGMFCVQLFFIISAYLTFKSLSKKPIIRISGGGVSYFRFLCHKAIRLVPVLYIAVFFHTLMDVISSSKVSLHNIFFALTFLNGFSPKHINPWANWYVGVLFIFFIIAPVLYKVVNTTKRAVILFIVSYFISFFSTYILRKNGIDTGWYFYMWLPNQMPILSIGI